MAVLVALACSATLGDRMGAAGAVSDLWGPPRPRLVARWEQTGKSWLVAASGGSEAREQGVAGSHRGRAPPATKAPVRAVSGGAPTACCLIAAPRPERRPCRACNRPCAPLVGAETVVRSARFGDRK